MNSVLVTGGTGFFGRNFVRHLLDNNLSERVCIYSRGEHVQAAMREEFNNDERLRWFIGDVRDRSRLRRAMTGISTVVHAAALKRIEVGAYNPIEMVRTNVDGSINIIEASQDAGVSSVVYLSTDKAWQPISPYGQSKAIAEALFVAANNTVSAGGTKFNVTRYGNVWNSSGSVVPRWHDLIAKGATSVPVTDPECTRFFMTIQQAIDLVLLAVKLPPCSTPIFPDMPAYRLGDLAEAMCVKMDIQGLPSWEKLHEGVGPGLTSDLAPRMSIEELMGELRKL